MCEKGTVKREIKDKRFVLNGVKTSDETNEMIRKEV